MAKKILLSERERVATIMFCERYEGSRVETRRMDKAIDVVDHDFVSAKIIPTPSGMGLTVQGGFEALLDEQEEFIFEDEPFKTLKTFLQSQNIPYSRRKDHVGRILMTVMDKLDKPEHVDVGGKGSKK
jgi:hypothetical protein